MPEESGAVPSLTQQPPQPPPASPGEAMTGVRVTLLLVVLASLSMLGPFSIDTPFPAFGAMRSDFAVGTDAMQYVVSAYLIAFGLMSPFHGPLSDALGRKPVILVGVGVYVLASIGAAFSQSLGMLLVFRVLQGLSAGGGVIVGRTVIRDLFEGPRAQRLMSQVMMIFGVAPAVAPLVGGLLLQVGPWPVVFWFMAAAGTAMVLAVTWLLPETHPIERRQPLRLSSLLASLAAVSRSLRFHRVAWAAALVFGGQFLYIGAAPIIVVDILGKGELDFWILFVPLIIGIVLGSLISSRAAGRVSGRTLVSVSMVGSLIAVAVNLLLAWVPATNQLPWVLVGPGLIALCTATAYPTMQLALLDMFPAHRGAAVSMFTFLTLVQNGLVAALVTPHVSGSMGQLAICAATLVALGALLWSVHLRLVRAPR